MTYNKPSAAPGAQRRARPGRIRCRRPPGAALPAAMVAPAGRERKNAQEFFCFLQENGVDVKKMRRGGRACSSGRGWTRRNAPRAGRGEPGEGRGEMERGAWWKAQGGPG